MVPASRDGCCVDRDVHLSGRPDLVMKAVFNNHQQQVRPPPDEFDLGVRGDVLTGGGKCRGEDRREEEVKGKGCPDDPFLAPPSPLLAAAASAAATAAAESSSPTVHGYFGTMNRKENSGTSRAPAQNGWPAKGNGAEAKDNGFVGVSEKRMRSDECAAVGAGNHGGEAFHEDCPQLRMRKRVHISNENTLDSVCQRGAEVGFSSGRVESSEGTKSVSPGVVTPAKSDEVKLSDGKMSPDSEVKGGVTPIRTEKVTGEGLLGTEEAILVSEGDDIEMFLGDAEARVHIWESGDHVITSSLPEESPVLSTGSFADVDLVTTENIDPVGIAEVGNSLSPRTGKEDGVQQEQPVLERDLEEHSISRPGSSLPADIRENCFQGVERSHRGNPGRNRPHQQVPRDVEVIQFDDSDDEDAEAEDVYESDGSYTKGKKPISSQAGGQQRHRNGYRSSSSESTAPSCNADDDSDSDDCRVVGSWQPPSTHRYRHRAGAYNPVVVEDEDDDNYTTSEDKDSDSSDVEVVGVPQSDIKRQWEEASMRRRMGRAMQSAGSKANASQGGTVNLDDDGTESQGLEESVATSTYRNSPDSKEQTETSEARGELDGIAHLTKGPQGSCVRAEAGLRPFRAFPLDNIILDNLFESVGLQVPNTPADSGRPTIVTLPGDITGSMSLRVETPVGTDLDMAKTGSTTALQSDDEKGESSFGNSDQDVDERVHSKLVMMEGLDNWTRESGDVDAVAVEAETSGSHEDLLAAKEKLKQTDHYRKTDAEEWASRQQEIERQAAESKRLRQRKKQEADRKKEMERKQKERIEELRLSQRKEERQMDLRDQLRGQVRTELDRIAGTCTDFATLLRKLGIPVEGGSHPSTLQVNAAYKKALFKFHPDRAVVSSQGEPRKQVEAEEKFKLIQRLKDTLAPVANDFTYTTYRSFF